jgi:hypothetical protein
MSEAEYQQFGSRLAVGDMVLSYSNSLAECQSGDEGIIGSEGLLARVRELWEDHSDDLPNALVERVRGEHADNLTGCDATILLCRATQTPVNWRDNLLAPLRLFGATVDRTEMWD